jgi:uncharacterized membrane protein SpoIIM required for sporulation
MNIDEFIEERKIDWQRLDEIVSKAGTRGRRRRPAKADLWEFGGLYLSAVSDLAVLRSSGVWEGPHEVAISYLNNLVASAHGLVHTRPGFRWSFLKDFLFRDFPAALRAGRYFIAAAAGLFFTFVAVGYVIGLSAPGFIYAMVPDRIISEVEQGRTWFKGLYALAPSASTQLMTHNVSVTFLMFAAGITFGIGTVYLTALNGLLLGAVAALCSLHDLDAAFWSFVLPHATLEITALLVAAGAGLVLGHALLDPGPFRRIDFVPIRARIAGGMILGCVPLLVGAGFIEAYFSPSPLPETMKFTVAGLLGTAVAICLFMIMGKRQT